MSAASLREALVTALSLSPLDHETTDLILARWDGLDSLRAAWNAHMETCPQHAALPDLPAPSWDDLERWRDAPSGTASA